MKLTVKDMTFTALMAVMIAICSWIAVPIGAVPITLQTFGAACALTLLGGKRGTLAIAVYILLGLVGVPVFSGFKGGAAVLFGMTGGYILGFILMGAAYWAAEHFFDDSTAVKCISLAVGLILCYAVGTVWFMIVYTDTKGDISLLSALSMCVFPFILPDIIKLAGAVLLSAKVSPMIQRQLSA